MGDAVFSLFLGREYMYKGSEIWVYFTIILIKLFFGKRKKKKKEG